MAGFEIKLSDSQSQYSLIQNGWFNEKEVIWPGQRFSIEVEEVLLNGKSKFQDILVFKSKSYGNVMVLDGVIQVTERDEFAYQEMITHIPICSSKQPKKVLIIGGGDGGVLREVVKYPNIEEIHMCEIDDQVIAVGLKYFRNSLSTAFDDPRLTLLIDDAAQYLKTHGKNQQYDVIICDSSDPVGPADVLFTSDFFLSMKEAVSSHGIICTQGECLWLHLELIQRVIMETKNIFPLVKYCYTTIPTYPSGQIGFIVATADGNQTLSEPVKELSVEECDTMKLKYYNSMIHKASFILPTFAQRVLN